MDITLFLYGSELEKVNAFKYLGVLINIKLSWSDHIDGILVCNKARKILDLVYRWFNQDSSVKTLGHYIFHWYVHILSTLHNYGIRIPILM